MRRSLASRLAALMVAGMVGLSAPSLALAHGYAHIEASGHADDHADHHHGGRAINAGLHEQGATVEVADESREHVHPQLSQALSVRVDALMFVLPTAKVTLPSGILFVGTASLLLTAAPARAGPADAPPQQPRAPPLG